MLEALAALCIACGATAAIRGYLYVRAHRLATQRYYRDRFFDIAERMYADEALSDNSLTMLRQMVIDLDDPRLFGELWKAVRDLENKIGAPRGEPVLRLPIEGSLHRDWASLFHSYLMAISYYRGLRGILVRAALARVLDPDSIERGADTINWYIHKWPLGTRLNPSMP